MDSLPWPRSTLSFSACPGTSEVGLGRKVRSAGAEPGGRVLAENSGAASLPTLTPGLCWWWEGGLGDGGRGHFGLGGAYAAGGEGLITGSGGVEFAALVGYGAGVSRGHSLKFDLGFCTEGWCLVGGLDGKLLEGWQEVFVTYDMWYLDLR